MAEITAADLREIFFSEDLIKGTEYEKNPKNFRLPVRWDGGDYYKELYLLLKEYRFRIEKKFPGDEYKEYRDDIKFVCYKVCLAVSEAFHGNPSKAYDAVDEALKLLTEKYECFMSGDEFRELSVYRAVDVHDKATHDRKRVFHVPFDKRHKMSTTRYSIPGYPALYLGTSVELNCAEIDKSPHDNTVVAARFKVCEEFESKNKHDKRLFVSFQNRLYILDLSVKPQDYDKADLPRIEAKHYLLWYPLIAACSFIRVYRDDPFAAEYVVPQIVTQWIKKAGTHPELFDKALSDNESFDKKSVKVLCGVCYFSCLSEKWAEKGLNFAFPSSGDDTWVFDGFKNFCPILAATFALTKPVFVSEFENAEACQEYLKNDTDTKLIGKFNRNGIIKEIQKNKVEKGKGDYEIPAGEGYIPDSTFSGCGDLEEIKIPAGLTSIGYRSFSYCSMLTNIDIPDSVTYIGNRSFEGCINLPGITIPGSVTYIGYRAFAGCSKLANVTINEGVISIGNEAFGGCTKLESLKIPNSVVDIGENAFANCRNLDLHVPCKFENLYDDVFADCHSVTYYDP